MNIVRPRAVRVRAHTFSKLALAGAISAALGAQAQTLPALDAAAARPANPVQSVPADGFRTLVEPRLGVPTMLRTRPDTRAAERAAQARPAGPEAVARAHLQALAGMYRLGAGEAQQLRLDGVHALPNGASIVQLSQQVDGIEVFRERASVLLGPDGGLEAIGGYVIGVGSATQAKATAAAFRLDMPTVLARALEDLGVAGAQLAEAGRDGAGYQLFSVTSGGSVLAQPARAKPVWFRDPYGLVPAYYLELVVDGSSGDAGQAYAYVVSAKGGNVLFRHRQQEDVAFGYRTWADPNPPHTPYPGPQGRNGTPHPTASNDGYAAPATTPWLLTLEHGATSTGDPWLPPDAIDTRGNNVDAYADLVSPDGFTEGSDLRATTTSPQVFDRTHDVTAFPAADDTQVQASVAQLFYTVNWLHDWFYDAGFDEASGNAQLDNYGRGGVEGDRLHAEAQDYSGANNANMRTPADGSSPRMQMYIFSPSGVAAVTASGAAAGTFTVGTAAFGPQDFDLTGALAAAQPALACEPLTNAADIAGKVALIDRGTCGFTIKVKHAQDAGAIAVIVANSTTGIINMGGTDASITIPSMSVLQADGATLRSAITSGTVDVRLQRAVGPYKDGTLDNSVVAHEWGHYISNRLIANASGLTTNQARAMGEGWADFHALLMMVQPEDALQPANADFGGTYAVGAFALSGPSADGLPNPAYYSGFRRYPYSTDFSRNPLTFRHIASGEPLPASPAPVFTGDNAQVHNSGEVWASMLWGCYAALLRDDGRLTFDQAQERMKRYLVAGYKMTPPMPTFIEARDALLSVIASQDMADFELCAQAFAERGAGTAAVAPDRYSTNHAGVVESFVIAPYMQATSVEIEETVSCDFDGVLDYGETGTVRTSAQNLGQDDSAGGLMNVSSTTAGVGFPAGSSRSFGATAPFGTAAFDLPLTIRRSSQPTVLRVEVDLDADGNLHTAQHGQVVGYDLGPAATDAFEAPNLSWGTVVDMTTATGFEWTRVELALDAHAAFGPNMSTTGLTHLVSPPLQVGTSEPLVVSFRHRHAFEYDGVNWDGAVIEISSDGGATWTDVGASMSPGYNGTIVDGMGNPLQGRAGFVATSAAWPEWTNETIDLGTSFAGQTVQLRFSIGTDAFVGSAGWYVDDLAVAGIDNAPFQQLIADQGSCYGLQEVAGSGQQTMAGSWFEAPLSVLTLDPAGLPQAGMEVWFTAPEDGASARFEDGSSTTMVVSDAAGVAVSPRLQANTGVGSYTVQAQMGMQTVDFSMQNVERILPVFSDGFE